MPRPCPEAEKARGHEGVINANNRCIGRVQENLEKRLWEQEIGEKIWDHPNHCTVEIN